MCASFNLWMILQNSYECYAIPATISLQLIMMTCKFVWLK